ncbi:MAG: hypothetical protein R2911_40200 [Caldilineaceae bacterium]
MCWLIALRTIAGTAAARLLAIGSLTLVTAGFYRVDRLLLPAIAPSI